MNTPFTHDLRIGQKEPYFPYPEAPYKQLQLVDGDIAVVTVTCGRALEQECLQTAEFVKTACNQHDDLVSTVRNLSHFLLEGDLTNQNAIREILGIAEAALAKARITE